MQDVGIKYLKIKGGGSKNLHMNLFKEPLL